MFKLRRRLVAVAIAAIAPTGLDAAILGPDAAACRTGGGAAALVRVDGFKAHTGSLRVQVYGDDPDAFLAKHRYLKRIDLPVAAAGAMEVCVALPRPGNYAIAVRHDVDGSGSSNWNDGGGFSRNPRLSLFDLKPRLADVVEPFGAGAPRLVEVVLNYRHGLSIGPAR